MWLYRTLRRSALCPCYSTAFVLMVSIRFPQTRKGSYRLGCLPLSWAGVCFVMVCTSNLKKPCSYRTPWVIWVSCKGGGVTAHCVLLKSCIYLLPTVWWETCLGAKKTHRIWLKGLGFTPYTPRVKPRLEKFESLCPPAGASWYS